MSERTYANADREEYNFWDHTELPHLNLIASGFDPDLDDEWIVRFDTSSVQALEFPRRQAREEARKEWEAGLITIDEYREIAGRPAFNVPQSRALWISPQKAPVPANDQDAAALGLGPDPAAGGTPGAALTGAPLPPGTAPDAAAADVAAARALDAGPSAAADVAAARAQGTPLALPAGSTATDAVAAARAATTDSGPGDAAADVDRARSTQNAALPGDAAEDVDAARATVETKALPEDDGYEVTDDDFDALSMAVAAAVTALLARQEGVILARLRAPKIRKYTRYWEPENDDDVRHVDADLDQDRVVSAARWAEEISQSLTPILQQAAIATARKVGQALTGTDEVPPSAAAAAIVTAAYAGEAITGFLTELATVLRDAQHDAADVGDLAHAVVRYYHSAESALIARVAETCAVATINGAADAAAEHAGPHVVRTWVTRADNRVRPAHKALQDKTLPVGTPYTIDGASLRYPGGPFAPIALTINCRCRLHYATDSKE
ncbi:hypothetical protein [Streptomyces sp. HC307]|uniref:hypothetical protein n=1 Tax=Streptomyces flavusporus TaxID=3385496 RepID=UPI003917062B